MDGVILQICALSGPVPNTAAYQRYLLSLSTPALERKLNDLREDLIKGQTQPVRDWRVKTFAARAVRPQNSTP